MITENLEKGGVFTTLFNDFWKATMSAAKTGKLPDVNCGAYGELSRYAKGLYGALEKELKSLPSQDELMKLFKYFWAFTRQFINCQDGNGVRSDSYWEILCDAVDMAYKRYHCDFAKEIFICFLDEMERRDKQERALEKDRKCA